MNAEPERPPVVRKGAPPAHNGYDRPRRDDINDAGGYVPMPEVQCGRYLVDMLFRIGPGKKDGPLESGDLLNWQTLLGLEWTPWEAETLFKMSQAYVAEAHGATKHDALPPWKEAVPMWRWVQNQKAEKALDRFERKQDRLDKHREKLKKKESNGNRQ